MGDTIFIFCLALIIFGPKKLPEIGRQIGKLMVEFRRASNEFKMQIEEELRASEEAERQKEISAAAAKPPAAIMTATAASLAAGTASADSAATPVVAPPSVGVPVNRSFAGSDVAGDGAVKDLDATAETRSCEAASAAVSATPGPAAVGEVDAYPESADGFGFNPGLNTASNGLSAESDLAEPFSNAGIQPEGAESARPAVHHG